MYTVYEYQSINPNFICIARQQHLKCCTTEDKYSQIKISLQGGSSRWSLRWEEKSLRPITQCYLSINLSRLNVIMLKVIENENNTVLIVQLSSNLYN